MNGSMCTAPWEPLHLLQPGGTCVVTRARHLLAAGREERVVAYRVDLAAYVNQRCRCVFGTRGVLGQRHRGQGAPAPFLYLRWVVHARAGVSGTERGV